MRVHGRYGCYVSHYVNLMSQNDKAVVIPNSCYKINCTKKLNDSDHISYFFYQNSNYDLSTFENIIVSW